MNDQYFRVGEQGVLQITRTDDNYLLMRFRGEVVAFFALQGHFETQWVDSHESPVPTSYVVASNPDKTGATVLFQQLVASSWNVDVAVGWLSIRIEADGSQATLAGSIIRHEPSTTLAARPSTPERSGILMAALRALGYRKETR